MSSTNHATLRSKVPKKLFVLTEEYEDELAIRQFSVLCISDDKDFLRKELQTRKALDSFGYIEKYGLDVDSEDCFSTVFAAGEGFVSCSISETPFLESVGRKDEESL